MYALDLKTALDACKADRLPYLVESGAGRIVNVGAGSAIHAASGFGPYAASKSAVHRLTESLADELKLKGVTVNAVLPSIIDTPLNRRDMPNADFSRWVAPADIAAVILFLASDEARAVTGRSSIPVSGRVSKTCRWMAAGAPCSAGRLRGGRARAPPGPSGSFYRRALMFSACYDPFLVPPSIWRPCPLPINWRNS